MVRASLPLVAGLLCYHGLVLWCVGLQLCHWSLRSARAWVLGGCPRSRSSARSRGTPAARGAASAAPPVASGSATRRRRARAGPFGVQRAGSFLRRAGFVDCGRVFFRRQTRVSRPVCTAFGPARLAGPSTALLWRTVRAARHRGGIESVSARFCINFKVLKSCCGPRVEGSTTGGAVTQAGPPQCAVAAHKCAPP